MKRVICQGIVVLTLILLVPICLSAGGQSEAGDVVVEGEVTLTLGTIYPPAQPASIAIEWAVEEIEKRSDGRIEIKHFHSGQLGNNDELANGVMSGSVDINVQSLNYFEGVFPDVAIDGAFFLYENIEHMKRAWDGKYGDYFRENMIEKTGIRIIGNPWLYGKRVITTKGIPVRKPADLVGAKIRAPGAAIWLDQVSSFGCTATPVAFPELYFALSQGVVDGQENPISVIYSNKFYEVQDYMSITNHKLNLVYALINETTWNDLSQADQQLLTDVFNEAAQQNIELIEKADEEGKKAFIENGGTIIENVDREAFRNKVLPLYEVGGKYEHLKPLVDLCNSYR